MMAKTLLTQVFPGQDPSWYDEVCEQALTRSYGAGELIIRPGEKMEQVMFVTEGLIKVYRTMPDGSVYFLYFIGPGEACVLSLQCLNQHRQQPVMARAVSSSEVLMVPAKTAKEWATQYPAWNNYITATYFKRIGDLLCTIDSMAFQQMDVRLLSYLENQALYIGKNIPLTHQEIARDMNTSREVISRLLKKLEAKGKVILHRSSVEWIGEAQTTMAS